MGGTLGIGDGSGKLMRSSSLGQNDNQPIDSSNRAFHQIGLYLTRVAFKRRKYFFKLGKVSQKNRCYWEASLVEYCLCSPAAPVQRKLLIREQIV